MNDKQKVIVAMDVMGWEQDGIGLDFIKVSTGENRHFSSFDSLSEFCIAECKKFLGRN